MNVVLMDWPIAQLRYLRPAVPLHKEDHSIEGPPNFSTSADGV